MPINPQFAAEITAIETEAAAALKSYRDSNEQLQVIRTRAPKSFPSDAISLETALAKIKQDEAAAQLSGITKKVKEVKEQINVKAADAAAAHEKELADLKAENKRREDELRLELEKEKARTRTGGLREEITGAAAQNAKDQLEREFQKDLPDIQSLLRPFITDGDTQPRGRQFARTGGRERPVSFAKLKATTALQTNDSSQRLLYSLTACNRTNDRDLGAFPSYFGGESDWKVKAPIIQKAQELLIKYGDLMVEKGMVAP